MANKRITDLQAKTLPYAGGEVGVVDDGTTTYRADLRYWGLANAAMTYNPDGTMATLTKAGRTTTFTYTDMLTPAPLPKQDPADAPYHFCALASLCDDGPRAPEEG
jgi:hypothetical protein